MIRFIHLEEKSISRDQQRNGNHARIQILVSEDPHGDASKAPTFATAIDVPRLSCLPKNTWFAIAGAINQALQGHVDGSPSDTSARLNQSQAHLFAPPFPTTPMATPPPAPK